ncbi:MAG: NAD(P)H-dependent oxidoreductase subunit E [Pseudomonadota bacterium]
MRNAEYNVESIVACCSKTKVSLVEILLEIKEKTGSISENDIRTVSDILGLDVVNVQGVASFFNGFDHDPEKERSRKKAAKEFDPWGDPPCKLWLNSR